MSRSRVDFADPAARRAWALDLRVAVDDADAIVTDALQPIGRRELGRALHRANYADARRRIVALLDSALSAPDVDPSDPAGSGGSPCH